LIAVVKFLARIARPRRWLASRISRATSAGMSTIQRLIPKNLRS
jgi:hypothetical protein